MKQVGLVNHMFDEFINHSFNIATNQSNVPGTTRLIESPLDIAEAGRALARKQRITWELVDAKL